MSELFLHIIYNIEKQIKMLNSKYNIDNPKKLSGTGSRWLSWCQEIVHKMYYLELNSCIFKIFTYSVMNRVYARVLGTDLDIQYCKLVSCTVEFCVFFKQNLPELQHRIECYPSENHHLCSSLVTGTVFSVTARWCDLQNSLSWV